MNIIEWIFVFLFLFSTVWIIVESIIDTPEKREAKEKEWEEGIKEYEEKISKYKSRYVFDNFSVTPRGRFSETPRGSFAKHQFPCYDYATIEYDVVDNRVYCTLEDGLQFFYIKSNGDLKDLYKEAKKEGKIHGILKVTKGGNMQIKNYLDQPVRYRVEFFCNFATPTNEEGCHVYIMKNEKNGFHKIGISNNPDYREKTLQSEEPEVTLLRSKEFPNRKIAYAFEQALHKAYDKKRVRGEWFNLSNSEVEEVISSLY